MNKSANIDEVNIEKLLLNINYKLDNLEQQNKEFNDKLDNLEQQNKEFDNKLDNLEKEIKDLKKGQSNKEQLNKEINKDDLYYFYIVSDSLKIDYFKIGITSNIKSRLSSIQTGNSSKVYLIDFLVGNKENIIQLEKTLKEKMSDYNLSGEWFQLEDKDRMKLFNWLNEVKLNKNKFNDILDLDLDIPKKDNEIETIQLEDDKQEIQIKKLSELKNNEIIELLKDYLKNVNGELMFKNNLTNNFSIDYNYLFEILEGENIVKNDLNKKDFNELFKKLNNEYLCCFETLNKSKDDNEENQIINEEILNFLNKLNIDNFDELVGYRFKQIYNFYKNHYQGNLSKKTFKQEMKKMGYISKQIRINNNVVRSVLQKIDDDNFNKKIKKELIQNDKNYSNCNPELLDLLTIQKLNNLSQDL